MRHLGAQSRVAIFIPGMFGIVIFMLIVPVLLRNVEFSMVVVRVLNVIGFALFPMSFIAFLVMIINLLVKPPIKSSPVLGAGYYVCCENWPLKSGAFFVVLFVSFFMVDRIMSSSLRNTVKSFLNNVSPEASVKVKGKFVKKPKEIIEVVKGVQPLPAHHSHETEMIHIEIISRDDSLLLELGRDSQRSKEYWVSYPKFFSFTTEIHIGGIITNLFDEY